MANTVPSPPVPSRWKASNLRYPWSTNPAKLFTDKLVNLAPECDFAAEIAFLYPLKVVMDLIGVPAQDHLKMLELTQWLFTYADPDLKRPGF